MSSLEKLVLAAAAEEISSERRGRRDVVTTYAQAIARAEELERENAAMRAAIAAQEKAEPVALEHIACIEDGELRFMSGRKAPAYDCELYAMPDGKNAPKLYLHPPTAQPAQPVAVPDGWALVPVEPTPTMMNIARGALAKRNLWGVWKAMLAAAPAHGITKEPQ